MIFNAVYIINNVLFSNPVASHVDVHLSRYAILPNERGGSVAGLLERWTCNSKAPSSRPALTASWICSR